MNSDKMTRLHKRIASHDYTPDPSIISSEHPKNAFIKHRKFDSLIGV